MMKTTEGPPLEALTRRLAETPDEFLAEPRIGRSGRVRVQAVVQDLLAAINHPVAPEHLSIFAGSDAAKDRNRLSIALIFCWLLWDDYFKENGIQPGRVLFLLDTRAEELSKLVASKKFVSDPDRREELARLALSDLGYRPAGETESQSEDRLEGLSSTHRARVLAASREAEKRAQAIREQLRRKAAEESADKWSRE
ncbi:MAG: hypothetical protein ACP5SH_18235 [Syntrophobacteraceae bacterium]